VNNCLLLLYSFLPGGSSGTAASRLDQTAFSGPSGAAAGDQIFTADSFHSWLLTTFDEACLPLIIVSNCYYSCTSALHFCLTGHLSEV